MENEDTIYEEGSGDDFKTFLFSSRPKEPHTIKLELNPCERNIKFGLHLFQELLMIYSDGMKYLFSKKISDLTDDDKLLMNNYFKSFGFITKVEKFNIKDYFNNIKLPNYFKDKYLIKDNTRLTDIYYEVVIDYIIYRLSFDFLK